VTTERERLSGDQHALIISLIRALLLTTIAPVAAIAIRTRTSTLKWTGQSSSAAMTPVVSIAIPTPIKQHANEVLEDWVGVSEWLGWDG